MLLNYFLSTAILGCLDLRLPFKKIKEEESLHSSGFVHMPMGLLKKLSHLR